MKTKKLLLMVLVVVMSLGLMAAPALADETPFEDVDSSAWYYDYVEYVRVFELMNGVSETEFAPEDTATRAMIVTVLYRLAGEPMYDDIYMHANYADVAQGSWYEEAVGWAAYTGVAEGVGEGFFNPEGSITREQLITMVYRYEGSPAVEGELGDYPVSDWAEQAMIWAEAEMIVNGLAEGSIMSLQNPATRAEIAGVFTEYLTEAVMADDFSFLVGSWDNDTTLTSLTFYEDGTFDITTTDTYGTGTYDYLAEQNLVTLYYEDQTLYGNWAADSLNFEFAEGLFYPVASPLYIMN